ncbi:unnamed protein product [Gadus morhua 'NCC']
MLCFRASPGVILPEALLKRDAPFRGFRSVLLSPLHRHGGLRVHLLPLLLKAVKSCLVCLISYCQTHLEPHQRVAGLKKHRLVDPMDRLEDRMCKKHDRLLELFCHTEQCQDDLNQMVKERMKDTEKEAEDLIKELEQEIEVLTNRSSEVKQLSQTKDHLHFLQGYKSLKNSPSTRDWTTVEVCPPSHVGTLRRSLDPLEETLNIEMKKLRDAELKRVQQYEVDVTLDPDTASPSLILYEDGKQVHDGDVVKKLPEDPKRLTHDMHVLPDLKPGLKKCKC